MAKSSKKNLEITENFFSSNIFLFNSFSCESKIDKTYPFPGADVEETLKVYSNKDCPIRFAFASKVGLVRLNEDGSIAESNVLGKLLAIDNKKLSNYNSFFKRNGFLLPISNDKFETINAVQISSVINRLNSTLELMSTITDMSRLSYEKIVRLIIKLLFGSIVEIETNDGKNKYTTTKHPYTLFLDTAAELTKDGRLNDTFNNAEFDFKDSIYPKTTLPVDFVTKVAEGYADEDKYTNPLFINVLRVYLAPRESIQKSFLLINDFLFQYFYNVGVIQTVDGDKTIYVNGEVHKDKFDDKLKDAAIKVAKLLIKEEIDFNLRRVRVSYDIKKMEPSWKIDSLLSALYFGLFYMRPSLEVYRRCANPKCNEFFLVSVTSHKKKYCCKECMNRDIQTRYRANQKRLKSKTD